MPIGDTAYLQAVAAASEARAEVKDLEVHLHTARMKLKVLDHGDAVVDAVTSPKPIHDSTEFVRRRTQAALAEAQAEVDRTMAELEVARRRLVWAERAVKAVGGLQDLIEDES